MISDLCEEEKFNYGEEIALTMRIEDNEAIEYREELKRLLIERERTYRSIYRIYLTRLQARRFRGFHTDFDTKSFFLVDRVSHNVMSADIRFTESMSKWKVREQDSREALELKVRLLENQLHCDRPYLQLYRLGAGGLFVSIISILMWLTTHVGAPFHPLFAAVAAPVSGGQIAMGYLVKPKKPTTSQSK